MKKNILMEEKTKKEVACKMLKENIDISTIIKVTGLKKEEIETLE